MALDPLRYSVVWFAPLEIEARAAACMLDHRHEGYFAVGPADDYVLQAGDVCGYNVIIASFPAGHEYGTSAAAALASQVKTFFPNLHLGLLVGVAAGLPHLNHQPERDIRLGDVLVALSVDNKPAVVAYDLGKQQADGSFTLLRDGHVLSNTKTVLRSAIGTLKAEEPHSTKSFLPYYHVIEHQQHATGTFVDPGQKHDHYLVDGKRVHRGTRPTSQRTRVWYGAIGSGDTLMKDPRRRNELRERHGILGLEMEAAGIMNHIPVAVIRGVCDYGDEYKNKEWQPYAAAMAAAYAKAVLQRIPPKPGMMGNPSPKDSLSVVSGEMRNEVELPQAFGQSTLTLLIQRITTSPITDSVTPLIDILRRYLQTAMLIPRGLSRSIIIRDFLGRDLHFELPLDWYDLRVILLPHFDTRERHGLEKIRNDEFLIVHCDRSEKHFKRIGPSNWKAQAEHGRRFHMFAAIFHVKLQFQVCTACRARMKKFRTYLVCPNCGLFSLSAYHQQTPLMQEYKRFSSLADLFFLTAHDHLWTIHHYQMWKTDRFRLWTADSPRTQHPVGVLSSWETSNRKSEIRRVASVSVGGEIGQFRPSSFTESARLKAAAKWVEKILRPYIIKSDDSLSDTRGKSSPKKDPKVQREPTGSSRRNPPIEQEATRLFKNILIREDPLLYDTVKEGNVESVKGILTRLQASQISVDATWGVLGTPLVAAIVTRSDSSDSVIEALLQAGADPLQSSGLLGVPLHVAVVFQNTSAVEIMLGSIMDRINTASDAEIQHLQGVLDKSLFQATFFGHSKLITLLLYAGANPFAAAEPGLSAFALLTSREFRKIGRDSATDFVAEGYGRGLITSDEARLLIDAVHGRYVPTDGTPTWLNDCCRRINARQAKLLEKQVARRLASSTRECFLTWPPFWRQPLMLAMKHFGER